MIQILSFTCRQVEAPLPLGDNLGDLTDELDEFGRGSFISEAVFTSEKSYAFIVNSPNDDENNQTVCKVKGIRLNLVWNY